eukprot:3686995-Amphidinium_carterae.1
MDFLFASLGTRALNKDGVDMSDGSPHVAVPQAFGKSEADAAAYHPTEPRTHPNAVDPKALQNKAFGSLA